MIATIAGFIAALIALTGFATPAPQPIFGAALKLSTVGTSTFPGGISIGTGCFAVSSTCLSLSSFTGTVPVSQGGTGLTTAAQGDLLYGTGFNVLSRLAKNTTATRYLSNTGSSNDPAWAQINLANGITGDLPFANLTQGAALTVLANATNGTADFAALAAGSDHQVLRRSGTAIAFGAINLAQSAAITGALGIANAGLGVAFTDPNADRLMFWDDSAGAITGISTISGGSISGTTLTITGSSPTAVTLIPHSAIAGGGDAPQIDITANSNTTMWVGQVIVPFGITVNKVTIHTGNTNTVNGTVDISLYSEDGQTRLFSVTTASITSTENNVTTAVGSVALTPGVYYIAMNTNSTTNLQLTVWETASEPFDGGNGSMASDISSEPLMEGTVTITAGTPPTTITPTSITETSRRTIIVRLDN